MLCNIVLLCGGIYIYVQPKCCTIIYISLKAAQLYILVYKTVA